MMATQLPLKSAPCACSLDPSTTQIQDFPPFEHFLISSLQCARLISSCHCFWMSVIKYLDIAQGLFSRSLILPSTTNQYCIVLPLNDMRQSELPRTFLPSWRLSHAIEGIAQCLCFSINLGSPSDPDGGLQLPLRKFLSALVLCQNCKQVDHTACSCLLTQSQEASVGISHLPPH